MAVEQPARVPLRRTASEQAEEDHFQAVYGAWTPLSPTELRPELAGFSRPWWVVGGWAIEAATGFRREHEDTDISILCCDVPAFVAHMSGRWHVWNNVDGVLHPLGGRWLTVDEPQSQLWLRANGSIAPRTTMTLRPRCRCCPRSGARGCARRWPAWLLTIPG